MKKCFLISFLVALLCLDAYSITLPPSIANYRWRNDDGNETTATWKAPENDSIFHKGEGNIRLRMEIATNGQDLTQSTGLYYKYTGDTIDTLMHLVSNDLTNAFVFASSSHIVDGAATTQQLSITGSNTDVAGFIKENAGFFNFTITTGERKELEFCIKASPNANYDNIMYNFVLAGEDSSGFFYLNLSLQDSILPTIILQKTELTVTVNNASKSYGQDNPEFTLSYSGFIDGDDASVLDTLPKIITDATKSSAAGTYDLVPYGSYDNKYTFKYVKGNLTISATNSVNEENSESIILYPNPVSDIIYVKGDIPFDATAKIYDLTGRLVVDQKLSTSAIDISQLNSGNYILKINESVFSITKK